MEACKVKICGLSRREDIVYANTVNPDYIGFVFWEKSRRYVTKQQAKELGALLKPDIRKVGVFVDAQVQMVLELLNEGIIDMAQLHGNETDDYIAYLKVHSLRPVIKAVRFVDEAEGKPLNLEGCTRLELAVANHSNADYLLLDSGMGSGKAFDWNLVKQIRAHITKPFFLAGGIGAENVRDAIKLTQPFAIDLSSSLETDGAKDFEKMQKLMDCVRCVNNS